MSVPTFGIGVFTGVPPQITVPPGNPDELAAASRVYAAAGESLSQLANRVRGTGQSVVGAEWCGVASFAYLSTSDHAADWLVNAYQALSLGASALATYALELRQAQDTARAAQAAAVELDTAANHLQAQVANDPMQMLGLPTVQTRQAADLIVQGRQKAAALGAEAERMAQAAAAKAAAAFAHTASMTQAGRIAAAKAAAAQQAAHESSHSWLQIAGVVGLGIVDAGLTVANVAQLGLDPVTDAAEAGTVSATAGLAADLAEGGAAEAASVGATAAGEAAEGALADTVAEDVAAQASSKPDWLVRLQRMNKGNEFNAERGPVYEAKGGVNELYVEKTPEQLAKNGYPYNRVDSYVPRDEIVSRKYTQLGEVNESTAKGYLQEFSLKYEPGTPVADVPSTPSALRGTLLDGDMVLEVPVQTTPVPQSVLDLARELDITIRDVTGTIYGP